MEIVYVQTYLPEIMKKKECPYILSKCACVCSCIDTQYTASSDIIKTGYISH